MTNRISMIASLLAAGLLAPALTWCAEVQDADVAKKLDGFDAYMAKVLKDWNTPGSEWA